MADPIPTGGGSNPARPVTRSWWVLIPANDVGKSPAYLDRVDFRTTIPPSDPNYRKLLDGKPISDYGMQMVAWKGPFATEAEAIKAQNPQASPESLSGVTSGISNWFTSLGADIGSGIESGVVNLIKDIWRVISGPLLIIVGVIILVAVFAIFFKDDITEGARVIGSAASMAAI